MLKRLYVDNFKCLVNFDLAFDSLNLFLGPNGAGKSTIFKVLQKIQELVNGEHKVTDLFKHSECTRWQTSLIQSFELDVAGNGGLYKYELAIEHTEDGRLARIEHERLWFDNGPLLKFEMGEVQLYRDNHSEGPKYPFDWSRSAVSSISPRKDNARLTWFREWWQRLIIVQINPILMLSDSQQEENQLSAHAENFASWYRHVSQDQSQAIKITNTLGEVLDGFSHFKFEKIGGQTWGLKVIFSSTSLDSRSGEFTFGELSDGQRVLITLHTLLSVVQGQSDGYTLCLDEPENFVALPEIQPWLVNLYDACNSTPERAQALLISHNPEIINYLLASPIGYWLERQNNGATRVNRIIDQSGAGLPPSELVARGWLHE